MNPNRDNAVVGIHARQRRFSQQNEVSDLAGLNGSHLRVELELAGVIDRCGSKDLLERQPGVMQLLHL